MKFRNLLFVLFLSVSIIPLTLANACSDSLLFSKFKLSKESSAFLFTAGYKMPVNKNTIINSGHGLYLEGGLNPGRLISKNLVFGIYVGWAFQDRLWSTSFNQDFTNDFKASISKDQNFTGLDSAVISSSSDLFKNTKGNSITLPGCEMKSFHNYSYYYGVVLKLPYKYIPIIKLYTGTTRSHYQGGGNIATNQTDYNIFELRRVMYGCELVIFKGVQNLLTGKNQKKHSNRHTGALSVYYESCNFSKSSLYFYDGINRTDIALNKFTNSSFLNKYKNEVSLGFKISFYIM